MNAQEGRESMHRNPMYYRHERQIVKKNSADQSILNLRQFLDGPAQRMKSRNGSDERSPDNNLITLAIASRQIRDGGQVLSLRDILGGRQFNRLAMRSMQVALPPFLFAAVHVGVAHQPFSDAQLFESAQPVLIVVAAGMVRCLGVFDLLTEQPRPLGPGKTPGLG